MKKLLGIIITVAAIMLCCTANISAAVNYAANSRVSYKSSDGMRDLIGSSGLAAERAIDGDLTTGAVAGGEWSWALRMDLGEEKKNVGKVVLQFLNDTDITSTYQIRVSQDGTNWENVVTVQGNKDGKERTHEFSPVNARYVMISDISGKVGGPQMAISNVEVYSVASGEMSAELVSPANGEIGVSVNKAVEIRMGQRIKKSNLYNARLIDAENNSEVLCAKSLSADGRTIKLQSAVKLDKMKTYNVMFGTRLLGSFTTLANDPMKYANAKIISKLKGIEMALDKGIGNRAIDGDTTTYAKSYLDDQGAFKGTYLDVDFGRVYQGISLIKINFKYKPVMFYIRSSEDGIEWNTVKKVYTKDLTEIMSINVDPFTARYVRIEYGETYHWVKEGHADLVINEFSASCNAPGDKPEAKVEFDNNRHIVVTFNSPIRGESVNDSNIMLKCQGVDVDYGYEFNKDMTQVTLIPVDGVSYDSEYDVTITENVTDIYGRKAVRNETKLATDAYKALEIATVSSDQYSQDKENAIYPAFYDDMPYEAWTMDGSTKYYQIKATGGYAPYSFKITAGNLPKGFVLSADGKISGTAECEETAVFTVEVTDVKGTSVSKALSMEVKPYRGKWFYDARFGIMNQWTYTTVLDNHGIPWTHSLKDIDEFEKLTKFNAAEWAEKIAATGAKVYNQMPLAGNGVKMYKSDIETEWNAHLNKIDMTRDLISELHKRGVKYIGYVAPEFNSWGNAFYERDLKNQSQSRFLTEAVSEMIKMGMDGVWFDTGYFNCFIDWDEMVAAIRTINPEATIQINPSVRKRAVFNYPIADIEVSECSNLISTDDALLVGYRSATRKKMAIEMTALLGTGWDGGLPLKSKDAVIKNIQDNWDNNTTYMLVYGAEPDGGFLNDNMKDEFYEIIDWVKENIDDCTAPTSDLDENVTYASPQTVTLTADDGAKIYYTTDGSIPSDSSTPYMQPIEITKSTRLRACAYIDGKRKSRISEFEWKFEDTPETKHFLPTDYRVDKNDTDTQNISCMTGMLVTVGQNPVEITAVGRYVLQNTGARHKVAIYDFDTDVPTLLSADLNEAELATGENGFQYMECAPVRLQAGRTYYILCEETPGVPFYRGPVEITSNPDILYAEGAMSDKSWTQHYTTDYLNEPSWQILDLKYNVIIDPDAEYTNNIARYSKFKMTDNSGNPVNASNYIHHAYHAGDGNPETLAIAGDGAWAWSLYADMYKTYSDINEIKVQFASKTLKTDFEIYSSTDNKNWTLLAKETGHDGSDYTLITDPFEARYIKFTFLKPDGPGQGGQGGIAEMEIYSESNKGEN